MKTRNQREQLLQLLQQETTALAKTRERLRRMRAQVKALEEQARFQKRGIRSMTEELAEDDADGLRAIFGTAAGSHILNLRIALTDLGKGLVKLGGIARHRVADASTAMTTCRGCGQQVVAGKPCADCMVENGGAPDAHHSAVTPDVAGGES